MRRRHPHRPRPAARAAAAGLAIGLLSIASLRADPPGADWHVVFEDDFDGAALDASKWSHHYPWSRTHNHDAYSRVENVAVAGGRLVLTARQESFGGKPYTTGVVNTSGKFHTTYGWIEARMKMPSSRGSWPAFWMLQSGWPPEIDIMEFPLADTSQAHNEKYRYWWNYHWGTTADHRSAGEEEWMSSDLTQGFHDYAVEWTADALRFYFDGELRGTVANRAAIAESAGMYIILNFAVGGWPGPPPSWPANGDTFEIDWVRVWQPGRVTEPDELVDLGNIVGGGDGRPETAAPHVGIHPATGAFSSDLDLGSVTPSGANPRPADSPYVDSVFLLATDRMTINSAGTAFIFPAGDAHGSTWDLISNATEADGPRGALRLGPQGSFTRGIGLHAAAGITFDLDRIRARHGAARTAYFSAWAGEGSVQAGGRVRCHAILAAGDGRILRAVSTGPHTDDGALLELEVPGEARFLTLATGAAGDGNGQDHGVFAHAFLTPCSVRDPALCPPVADEVLVFSGETWRYLDTGAAPPADWILPAFVAGGWKSGAAPLGYGNGDETTEIEFGGVAAEKHPAAWFRRTFAVRDAAAVSALSLRLHRDDGAVVYLNGVEALRSNLPAGALGPATLASAAIDGDDEARRVLASIDPCLLVEGTNVIAVEVRQASRSSSDLAFDLALAARRGGATPCAPSFVRGDCNGDGDTTGVTDAVYYLAWQFLGGATPPCLAACDTNGDGAVTGVTDAVALLQFSFSGGPPPPPPYPDCGPGELAGDAIVGCEMAARCE